MAIAGWEFCNYEQDRFTFQVRKEADTVTQKFPEEMRELRVYVYEYFWCFQSLKAPGMSLSGRLHRA